jgi:hypothetical protein
MTRFFSNFWVLKNYINTFYADADNCQIRCSCFVKSKRKNITLIQACFESLQNFTKAPPCSLEWLFYIKQHGSYKQLFWSRMEAATEQLFWSRMRAATEQLFWSRMGATTEQLFWSRMGATTEQLF